MVVVVVVDVEAVVVVVIVDASGGLVEGAELSLPSRLNFVGVPDGVGGLDMVRLGFGGGIGVDGVMVRGFVTDSEEVNVGGVGDAGMEITGEFSFLGSLSLSLSRP